VSTMVYPAAFIDERAELGASVEIGPGTVIGPHVRVGDRTTIGSHALLTGWTRIGSGCRIHHGAVVGSPPQDLKYSGTEPSFLAIGDNTEIREYVTANLATEPGATTHVGAECMLMAYSHVAHDCSLGDHVIIANAVQMAGYVSIEEWAIVGGSTVIHQFTRIGRHCMIGGGSRIAQDVAPFVCVAGSPPRMAGINRVGLERRGFTPETLHALDRAYKILFRQGLPVEEAVARLRSELCGDPAVEHLARFAETSVRGLTR